MKKITYLQISVLLFLSLVWACVNKNEPRANRETVLDQIVHLEDSLHTVIPHFPRWCDRLELDKKRINIGDCELYVEEEGEGMPIVVLHGGPGGTHHGFHPHFSEAAKFARMIYYDQRGCGLSDYKPGEGYTVAQAVEDLDKLRQSLNIDKWVVLGWSYGGYLAQRYMMKYPEYTAGLVLTTASTGILGKDMGYREYDFISDEEQKKMNGINREIKDQMKKRGWSREKATDLLFYNYYLNGFWKRQDYYKPTLEELAFGLLYEWEHDKGFNSIMNRDVDKMNLDGAFNECPIPTLIMESKWDLTWGEQKPRMLQANHPSSKMIVFEESGHAPFADEPERFFKELKQFVKKLPDIEEEKIVYWKQFLVEWKEKMRDKFLTDPITDIEAKAIEEFNVIWKRIQEGEKYLDLSTPAHTHLSFLSAIIHEDTLAMKKIQPFIEWTREDLRDYMDITEQSIHRIPAPLRDPEPGTIWPVYVKDPETDEWCETYAFAYWNGKWQRWGEMGVLDWRIFAEEDKADFLEEMNEKMTKD